MGTGATGATGGTFPGPMSGGGGGTSAPDAGGMCFLHVAIECDGDEDCSGSDVCCGDFDSMAFTYTAVTCRADCTGAASYKLCHPGETCPESGQECRRSQVIPHDFIAVCAGTANVPSEMTGRKLADRIVCGSVRCTGGQKCCLPAVLESGSGMSATRTALTPYCVDSESECDCGTDEVDAGADDAG